MRRSLIVGVAIGLLAVTRAAGLDDPEQLIRSLYRLRSIPIEQAEIARYFAADMTTAIQKDIGPADEIGTYNGGDWRYDAQDTEISALKIVGQRNGAPATVIASFSNFGKPGQVTYTLCLAPKGWRIADVKLADWDMRKALGLPAAPVRC